MSLEYVRGASAWCLVLALVPALALAEITTDISQPRPFGYVVGDVARQSVVVHAPGHVLAEDALPKPGRVSASLERTRADVVRTTDGWRLVLEYQFINAPREIQTLFLPGVTFVLRAGDKTVEENIAEWPVTLSPLTPQTVLARAGLDETRPDTPPLRTDTRPIVYRLTAYALVAGSLALIWASWYFGWSWRGRHPRHFARAARELRALSEPPEGRHRAALRVLHRALDRAAGSTLFASGLDDFIAARPHFAPARAEIAAFFARSQRAFFAGAATPAHDEELARVHVLVAQLARLEREAS
jgi:mxaA protein